MGHMIGAKHDGSPGDHALNLETYGKILDCPQGKHVMTPSQSGIIETWSTCSRFAKKYFFLTNLEKSPKLTTSKGSCDFFLAMPLRP